MKLLLLSNSTNYGDAYLYHAAPMIKEVLGEVKEALFIPYAAVRFGYDEYVGKVNDGLKNTGMSVVGIHTYTDPERAIEESQVIMIGGGNTFKLLSLLYHYHLLDPIKAKVKAGTPYVGWSAGANVACPTIRTTNDMPIVEPPSLQALGLVPFQVNPHYTEKTIAGHNGESKQDRIMEYIEENPNIYVACLPEGAALKVENKSITILGNQEIKVYRKLEEIKDISPGAPIDFLFHP